MNQIVRDEMRKWENEVDAETVKLIREGTPPYDAVEMARKIVERKRKRAAEPQP